MIVLTVLLLVLVFLLVAGLPVWPYSMAWGWTPAGLVGAIVLTLLILVILRADRF